MEGKTMICYEYEGEYIKKEDAWKDIKNRCFASLSERQALEEIIEDEISCDDDLRKRIIESFYGCPAHDVDFEDVHLGNRIDNDFDMRRCENEI
ncbi:hypothetical protein [Anaerostipes faecalis]|uniref:hypothetical protein n=2 Tax=Lachnospiraceae TaxID=186803 RepID=UPI001C1DEA65|nr:hypothetical protein [Anaerostipes faecalis]